ncbi:MAG: hypothetical protein ACXV4Z_03480 [Halobacteriota archaeon]
MTISTKKLLTTLSVLSFFILSAAAVPSTAASTATTHPIEYHIGVSPEVVRDSQSLQYFKSQGFCEVHLVARDQGTYKAELNTIKSLGMRPVLDIEIPIWDAGKYRETPIQSYANYFTSIKAAGWEYVASEGGRDGDVAYITQFFKGYINYNCDQCGLWHSSTGYLFYKQPGTVRNSWESYYTSEWPYIQQGAKEAAALGKQNGILAGAWGGSSNPIRQNSLTGGSPNYKEMLDWSYANGCGFTHFHVWTDGAKDGVGAYKQCGFEQIVSQLQQSYPATNAGTPAKPTATPTATPSPKVTPTPTPKAVVKAPTVKPTATPTVKPVVKPTATPLPTVTPTPTPKAVVKAPTATPTVNAQTTVKDPTPSPTVTPTPTATVTKTPTTSVKQQSTPTPSAQVTATQTPKEQLILPRESTSLDTSSNDTAPTQALSLAQPTSVASLPPQPILEFSVLGLGIPAIVAGAIYLLMRKE